MWRFPDNIMTKPCDFEPHLCGCHCDDISPWLGLEPHNYENIKVKITHGKLPIINIFRLTYSTLSNLTLYYFHK